MIQERNLAHSIFGAKNGEEVFFEVVKAAAASSTGMAATLISFKRLPEKVGNLEAEINRLPCQ